MYIYKYIHTYIYIHIHVCIYIHIYVYTYIIYIYTYVTSNSFISLGIEISSILDICKKAPRDTFINCVKGVARQKDCKIRIKKSIECRERLALYEKTTVSFTRTHSY
jgi:accessory gene regulator protein AgrB